MNVEQQAREYFADVFREAAASLRSGECYERFVPLAAAKRGAYEFVELLSNAPHEFALWISGAALEWALLRPEDRGVVRPLISAPRDAWLWSAHFPQDARAMRHICKGTPYDHGQPRANSANYGRLKRRVLALGNSRACYLWARLFPFDRDEMAPHVTDEHYRAHWRRAWPHDRHFQGAP